MGCVNNEESDERMAGLRNICRAYGGMKVSANGKTIHYVWDYANEEPIDKKLMTKAMQKASDIAYGKMMKAQYDLEHASNKSEDGK